MGDRVIALLIHNFGTR